MIAYTNSVLENANVPFPTPENGLVQLYLIPPGLSVTPGSTVSIPITLTSYNNSQPDALGMTMNFDPGDLTLIGASSGPSANTAGKGIECSNQVPGNHLYEGVLVCLVFGINFNTIPSGQIATLEFSVNPNTANLTTPLSFLIPNSLTLTWYSAGIYTVYNAISIPIATSSSGNPSIIDTISGFELPSAAAIAPNGAYAYVTNEGNAQVSIVSTSTNTITGTISGFNDPAGVALAPNGAYAYVTNYNSNTVSIVGTSTGTITGTISRFDGPQGVAIAPNGAYAYVTDDQSPGYNTISIVSTSTGTITGTISGFYAPTAVAIAPNGAYAYVVNDANDTISIINTATNAKMGTISGFYGPDGVAFAPSGAYAYVTNYLNNALLDWGTTVSIVNTSTGTITGTISGFYGPTGVAFAPNGHYAYVTGDAGGTDIVSVVNTGK